MVELLYRLFIGHNHRWVLERTVNAKETGDVIPSQIILVLQCSVCGCMKNHRIKG